MKTERKKGCVMTRTLRMSTNALDKEGVMAMTKLGKTDSNSADFRDLMAPAITCRARIRMLIGRLGRSGGGGID